MTLEQLNRLPMQAAIDALLACCGSRAWAARVAEQRPFGDEGELLGAADRTWLELGEADWRQAFGAHPRIGQRTDSTVSEQEQAAALSAADQVKGMLAEANRAYEQKFGFIFIVFAAGKTAEELLGLLRARLGNDQGTEIRNAAAEQMKITRRRLQSVLLAQDSTVDSVKS